MLNLIASDIVAHGTKLHYYRAGGDKPPLVLLHGLTDDGLCWTPVAAALADRFDVIMVDARGHGMSDAPEDAYTLTTLATEAASFVRNLALEKPMLLGHSMGAVTALTLAALYPDVPRAIIFEDPPPFWNFQNTTPEQIESRNAFIEWIAGLKKKTRDELLAEGHKSNPLWSEAEFGPWADSKYRCSIRVSKLAFPEDVPALDFDTLFKSIKCPAILIHADCKRGALTGDTDIAMLKEWLPHLQTYFIPGAGHNIRREQFSQYTDVVLKALTEIPDM